MLHALKLNKARPHFKCHFTFCLYSSQNCDKQQCVEEGTMEVKQESAREVVGVASLRALPSAGDEQLSHNAASLCYLTCARSRSHLCSLAGQNEKRAECR